MAVETYRPVEVTLTFAGIIIDGFAEGSFITAEKNEEAFALQVGSTGKAARAQTSNESGRVTFQLQQTSPVNAALSALHEVDKASGNGIGALALKDLGGADTVSAQTAWIVQSAPVEYSNEIVAREWIIEADNLKVLPGGKAI